MNQAMAIFTNV